MPKEVKVIVLRTAGTNCDKETAFAFRSFGAAVDLVHINRLFQKKSSLHEYHILAIPGGFTYGDDIMSGRIMANELRLKLGEDIKKFIADGKLIIGICNGFQVLVRSGILPGGNGNGFQQTVTLTNNDSGKFEDRWVYLKVNNNSVWTKGVKEIIYIPVAHAEGKFMPESEEILQKLRDNRQIVFQYCRSNGAEAVYPENPNGSFAHIAGICDPTGRVLGLMPHPERHFHFTQHPFWTRLERKGDFGEGARIFENGVNYIKEMLEK